MTLQFDNLKSFLQMGGYAAYVWSAYALVLSALAVNAYLAWHQLQQLSRKRKMSDATRPQI